MWRVLSDALEPEFYLAWIKWAEVRLSLKSRFWKINSRNFSAAVQTEKRHKAVLGIWCTFVIPMLIKCLLFGKKKNIFCNFMNHLTCLMNKCLFIQYNTVLGYVWCKMVDSFPPSWCGCDQINSSFWCLIVTSFFWHTDTAASDSRQDNPVLQH